MKKVNKSLTNYQKQIVNELVDEIRHQVDDGLGDAIRQQLADGKSQQPADELEMLSEFGTIAIKRVFLQSKTKQNAHKKK